ncbi:NAD(P)H-hydrate epimerase [Aliiroseovarius sp. Z3]|nr:NAD(P)H-hydrate epimerase [Aliiroseovarius sp. Z3]
MTELLTAAQMRAIEQAAIDSGEVTGLELMERAGRGVVEAIFEEWPELAGVGRGASPSGSPGYLGPEETTKAFKAVVLCGPGNNGGDGFVVARLLKERGWKVEVFLYGDAEKLPSDARVNYERWGELGAVSAWDDDRVGEVVSNAPVSLVVDALFGTGLTRALSSDLRSVWKAFMISVWADDDVHFVAVDIPSGVCSDSGAELGQIAWAANLTVTFHTMKQGHMLGSGPELCGKVVVKSIGLER